MVLITGAQKGIWFTTGNRDFTATEEVSHAANQLYVSPQPATQFIKISGNQLTGVSQYTMMILAGLCSTGA